MMTGEAGPTCQAAGGHCLISTATTHIGSSCACSRGQSRFRLVLVTGLGKSKAVPVSHLITNHTTVLRCHYYDGRVVISGYTFNQWHSSPNYLIALKE